jgi:hypothetical protein
MDKAIEFELIPDSTTDITNTCPIIIKSGEFKNIVYRYGKISFQELSDGGLNITMEIEVIESPENFNKEDPKFVETAGKIFTQLIEDQITKAEEQDLEADVHEDKVDNN